MLAKAGNAAADLQCGTHAPRLLRRARRGAAAAAVFAARAQLLGQAQRHARLLRRSAGCRSDDYLAFDHPLQQAIRRAVAHFTGVAGGRRSSPASTAARRRTTRCRSRGSRSPSRASPRADDDAGLRPRAARAGRRDDRASGNGVGRAAQRPRADAAPAAATGSPRSARKACRRSASAAAGSGIAIKVADGSKRGAAPGDRRGARAARAARRRGARERWRDWAEPRAAQLPRHRRPGDVRPLLSWTKSTRAATPAVRRDSPADDELTAPAAVCCCKRAPRGASGELASGPGRSACRRLPHLPFGGHNNE